MGPLKAGRHKLFGHEKLLTLLTRDSNEVVLYGLTSTFPRRTACPAAWVAILVGYCCSPQSGVTGALATVIAVLPAPERVVSSWLEAGVVPARSSCSLHSAAGRFSCDSSSRWSRRLARW